MRYSQKSIKRISSAIAQILKSESELGVRGISDRLLSDYQIEMRVRRLPHFIRVNVKGVHVSRKCGYNHYVFKGE